MIRESAEALASHAREEQVARIAGDLIAGQTCLSARRYVPSGESVLITARWCLVVPLNYEIDTDGILELAADAILEVT